MLLAALWNVHEPEQLSIENWQIAGKNYIAYIGNFGVRSSDKTLDEIPPDFAVKIKQAIEKEPPTDSVSWFRCFFCNAGGKHTFEALKNNEEWATGTEMLQALPWKKTNDYYSVRKFLLLKQTTTH